MTSRPADELAMLIEKTRRTIDQLHTDREALRTFDPRVAGEMPFDRAEAEAVYGAMIDAARRTLDTLITAARRVARPADDPRE